MANPNDPDSLEPSAKPPVGEDEAPAVSSETPVLTQDVGSAETNESSTEEANTTSDSTEFSTPIETTEPTEPVEPTELAESFEPIDPLTEVPKLLDTAELAYRIGWQWADFQLYVVAPTFAAVNPPLIIPPEHLVDGSGVEFVYTIKDYGFKLATSKSEDMFSAGMSMCKLYYTIEKMIYILVERLKSGGISTDTEVQVAFAGFILAQRKGFESIINLNYNVVVTNFEPGEWGELYLQTIKRLANKGYGYPPEAPRDFFKHVLTANTPHKP